MGWFTNFTLSGITVPAVDPLPIPANLYSAQQADFSDTSHANLRSNWTISTGDLQQIVGNSNTDDVRLDFDTPLVAGNAHIALWGTVPGTTGTYKPQFGGDGALSGNTTQGDGAEPKFHWAAASEVVGNYTRFGFNPLSDDLDTQITDVEVYDLSTVDPSQVACDVVLCLGDSNMSNAVSDFVTASNLTTPYHPAVFYMPCLRVSPNAFSNTYSTRHIPQPCIEPVQAASGASRVSPLQAFGAEFVSYSVNRGRPLLLLSLGDAGSGLNGTQDWRKTSAVATTGGRMYAEMLLMVDAMRALGPDHTIVGAIVSLGANDTTGADYNTVWVPEAQQFIADLRSEATIGDSNLPICWMTVGDHYEPIGGEDRGARMIAAIESLDAGSGSPNAVSGVKAVRPPTGNALGDATDPHYTAAGMQANGITYATGLKSLL